MTADAVAALLWALVTLYALTGGADFGGGIWDLAAGGTARGGPARALINRSIAPVWEANHVWLVIDLVVLWTAFPAAFGAIMSTLFIPLSLAAFGIILRGAGFSMRQAARTLRYQRLTGAIFASSSLITPFFMAASMGAIVTGRVPPGGAGNRMTSWTSPTAVSLGALSVAAFAYLAAVYLTRDARRHDPDLIGYFSRRALVSGLAVGALAGWNLYLLHGSAPRTFHRLTAGAGLAFVAVSFVLGVVVLACLLTGRTRPIRLLAAGAFAAVIWGWGVAQYPLMLPPALRISAAAAPSATLVSELVVAGIIVVLVVPSFVLLYVLSQRGILAEDDTGAGLASCRGGGEPPGRSGS